MKTRVGLICLTAGGFLGHRCIEAQVLIQGGSTYAQDFNSPSLAQSGTSSALPQGWHTYNQAGSTYTADDGAKTASGIYSYGSSEATDRALGMIGNSANNLIIGAQFRNSGAAPITGLSISYNGEQWLNKDDNTDKLVFQYSLDASSLTSGNWTEVSSLDFASPVSATKGALNGDLDANRLLLTGSITGLHLNSDATLWVRWLNINMGAKKEDGLAVDNFAVTAIPEPGAYGLIGVIGLLGWSWYDQRARKRT